MQSSVTKAGAERYKNVYTSTVYQTEHPIVAIHPATGERSLLLGHFLRRIVGLSASDSQHIVAMLQDHITVPENSMRWRWQPGDVAVWDNRAIQHRAIDDFGDRERSVKRVTVAGSTVMGIDGIPSRPME
jgi:alpha-ketoglutarate-dependent taurine dioxygenase